jgi:hypothetical protein
MLTNFTGSDYNSEYICKKIAHFLGNGTEDVETAILSSPYVNGGALGARQHSRDNRSGSTGSGKVITHGQIALVD